MTYLIESMAQLELVCDKAFEFIESYHVDLDEFENKFRDHLKSIQGRISDRLEDRLKRAVFSNSVSDFASDEKDTYALWEDLCRLAKAAHEARIEKVAEKLAELTKVEA